MTDRDSTGVVFVIGNLGIGGVVRVLLNITNHLTPGRAVVAVRVAEGGLVGALDAAIPLFTLDGDELSPETRASASAGGTRPPRGLTFRSAAHFWAEIRGLHRIVRRSDARVVSTFFMRGHLVALATRAMFDPRLRVVVNVHEHLSERATDDYPSPFERRVMRWLVRHVLSRADLIVVPAAALRDDLMDSYAVPTDRIVVLKNPVDLDAVRARATEPVESWAERRAGRRLLVGVGRLIRLKGYHVLVEALVHLPPDVEAIVVGAGPEQESLRALAVERGVSGRIRFLGPQKNPWRYMMHADCFVHPSESEAQCLVFVEAMTLGVPVVATSGSVGIRESLDNGRRGVLVAPRDARALAAGIARVLNDGEVRDSIIAQGRAGAEEHAFPVAVPRYEMALR